MSEYIGVNDQKVDATKCYTPEYIFLRSFQNLKYLIQRINILKIKRNVQDA